MLVARKLTFEKDFIVLEIKPADPTTSPFLTHQNPVFVRFTTDPYIES